MRGFDKAITTDQKKRTMSLKVNDCNHFCLLREQQNLYHRVSRSVLLGELRKVLEKAPHGYKGLEKAPFVTMGSTLNGEKKQL